jgi:predicted transcriptional regulator
VPKEVPEGRSKKRFTVAVDPGLARALDFRAKGAGMTRSAAVEEALSCWLRALAEEEVESLDRPAGGRRHGRGDEAGIAARMVLEALRFQFPAMRGVSDAELRRRATSGTEGGRGGP